MDSVTQSSEDTEGSTPRVALLGKWKSGRIVGSKGEGGMKIVKWQDSQVAPNPHGVDARKIYDSQHAQVIHITLKPGESLKKHITPVDVIFYVIEGHGVIEIGDEQQEVGPDTLIDSPARIPHRWSNQGQETLRFLVIKVPRPTESTTLL